MILPLHRRLSIDENLSFLSRPRIEMEVLPQRNCMIETFTQDSRHTDGSRTQSKFDGRRLVIIVSLKRAEEDAESRLDDRRQYTPHCDVLLKIG